MTATGDSPEAALLLGLQALLQPLTDAPGTLVQLPPTGPDIAWALGFAPGSTDPLRRWGQGVLTLTVRGPKGDPLAVHRIARPLVQRLTGLTVALDGITVNTSDHLGSASWIDGSNRAIRADTFPLDLDYQA